MKRTVVVTSSDPPFKKAGSPIHDSIFNLINNVENIVVCLAHESV